jgi:DNA-binding transcriptional ArsR family regulator
MVEKDSLDSLRVVAHPVRMRLLSLLTGAAMSAAEAARELGENHANVSYHLRRLHAAGLVHVAEEIRIRGGSAKRYRHDPDSGTRLRSSDLEDDQLVAAAIAAELQRRTEYRLTGQRGAMTDAELWVDEHTWQHCLAQVDALSRQLHAAAKPPRSPGTRRVSATISLFPMDPRR